MSQTIEIPTADGPAEAYLTGEDGRPGLLFYVDAIGLRPQVRDMADRMASWGYVVLVPHVFHRHGSAADLAPQGDLRDAGAREAFFAGPGLRERMASITTEVARADADAWMTALLRHAGDGPVGVVGYCMGARLAMRTAGWYPGTVAAVAGFHGGGLVTDDADSPHLSVGSATAAYVFGHADQDASMPLAAVETLETTLTDADRPHVNEVYEHAPHGYTMADTSSYDEGAAERAMTGLRALLERELGA